MPSNNAPVVINPSLDSAYFISKGFAPDVAEAMANGNATAQPTVEPAPAPADAASPPKPAAK